jgi:hypothetical protein
MALCAVMGVVLDVIDIDPRNGGRLSDLLDALGDDGPEIFGIASTPSHGAHFYIATQGLAKGRLLPGIDFQAGDYSGQGRGFVFLPPTVRPSKHERDEGEPRAYRWARPVHRQATPWTQEPSEALASLLARGMAAASPNGNGRRPVHELEAECLAAGSGLQRSALMAWIQELQYQGESYRSIADRFISLVTRPDWKNYNPASPYYPSRKGHAEYWIRNLYGKAGRIIPDATPEEIAELADMSPIREDPDEETFWASRPSLSHIRDFARARRAAPWATFGECLAEAICHTPPSFQLPPLVGGEGTLNMLIAMVGKSGAGKNAATRAAKVAFKWNGVLGVIENYIPRIPLGSGEGLARSFGYNVKDKDSGRMELVRSAVSAIVTVPEIDTFKAISDRSGATISPELRKLYSGEDLGFGWADPQKRIIIPAHSYRACVIAGVQPGRGSTILADVEGGFAQRWLWLPANDPGLPDEQPEEPKPVEWNPPGVVSEISSNDDGPVMKVCKTARDAIDLARVRALRGDSDDMESHMLYTRLKVAAGLALLDGCDMVRTEDWELSGYVLKVSARTRGVIERHLREAAHKANIAQGRAEGIRREAAESTVEFRARQKIVRTLLGKIGAEWVSLRDLKNSTSGKTRDLAESILDELVEAGRIESAEVRGQNKIAGKKYRKIQRR